ncbi:MAG TPA: 6,7-dimethyl-8-ribityllumazine synthase [Solirubrobacteraceae bacterium]|jgi:6,7-dimethyl-8-ribityllumazine synthase|nr:6,7-dimethyl-8-ribityllumazine synthase [Solirubrobacteraceae bacterium]
MAAYALVVARFYDELAARLEAGARGVLEEAGQEVEVFAVEGAFELAPAASYAVASGRFAGVVCLGAVIRGETGHYDHVCAAAAYGIQKLAIESGVPVTFGLLTVETYEQALARSGGEKRDSGAHAAAAALALAQLKSQLRLS